MKKERFFNSMFYEMEETMSVKMDSKLKAIYENFGFEIKPPLCNAFGPFQFFKKVEKEFHSCRSSKTGAGLVEWNNSSSTIVGFFSGKDIYTARIDVAGNFLPQGKLASQYYPNGDNGAMLIALANNYLKSVVGKVNTITKIADVVMSGGNFTEEALICRYSDMLYRLYDKEYTFQNMENEYPFLTKERLFELIEIHDLDVSELPIVSQLMDNGAKKAPKKIAKPKKKIKITKKILVEGESKAPAKVLKLRADYFNEKRYKAFSDEEKALVPKWEKNWSCTKVLETALESATVIGKNLLVYGPAGTGKSTLAKQIASICGLPYRFFTCSEKTDESNLLVSIIPTGNDGSDDSRLAAALSQIDLIQLDAPSWMQIVTGVYNSEVTEEMCYEFIKSQSNKSQSAFDFVESELINGIRTPALVEIQEPTVIAKPGVLVALNSLLDDGASIATATGEIVGRNPDTIIMLTTNVSYNGCRSMNQSVLSRMDGVIALDDISKSELVERAIKKAGLTKKNKSAVEQMADYFLEIRKYLQENGICDDAGGDGIIDPRGFVSWVKAYFNGNLDLRESCRLTIVSRTSLMDIEEQQRTWKSCVEPLIPKEINKE